MNNRIFTILGLSVGDINLFPETVIEEILQNVRIILTTVMGTVPLDRNFGIKAEFIDDPTPRGMMRLSIFATESIQDYEPRVEVRDIEFVPRADDAMDGRLYPKVTVRILDEFIT